MSDYLNVRPLCLVENTDDGLRVNEENLQILEQVQLPLVVAGVVGKYRTGKSYLLNRLMGLQGGFELGATVQGKTKGIWGWWTKHPEQDNCALLLLDSEGLDDVNKGNKNSDNHIFTLMYVLSSVLIYNVIGVLDSEMFESLHYITELSKFLKCESSNERNDGLQFLKIKPDLVVTLRDVTLEMVIEGKQVTPDEYLEDALKLEEGYSLETCMYNLPRMAIHTQFERRRCFAFKRPVDDERLLKDLETTAESQMNITFLKEECAFRSYVLTTCRIKTFEGRKLTGSMIRSLITTLVNTIRSGSVPVLKSAVETMLNTESEKALKDAKEIFNKEITDLKLPTETKEEFEQKLNDAEKHALSIFSQRACDVVQKHQATLHEYIAQRRTSLKEENIQKSITKGQQILDTHIGPLKTKVAKGEYNCFGGYRKYTCDKEDAKHGFKQDPKRGFMNQNVWDNYEKCTESERALILNTDNAVDAKQREMEGQEMSLRQLIEKHLCFLEEELDMLYLRDRFIEAEVFSDAEITSIPASDTRRRRSRQLLLMLSKKDEDALKAFLHVLLDANEDYVIQHLLEESKKTEQKRRTEEAEKETRRKEEEIKEQKQQMETEQKRFGMELKLMEEQISTQLAEKETELTRQLEESRREQEKNFNEQIAKIREQEQLRLQREIEILKEQRRTNNILAITRDVIGLARGLAQTGLQHYLSKSQKPTVNQIPSSEEHTPGDSNSASTSSCSDQTPTVDNPIPEEAPLEKQ